jgi:ACS family glucarate transporter-like MFS transporter
MLVVGLADGGIARWRPVFVLYGLLGIAWAWWYWRNFRDDPSAHPGVNEQELALIGRGNLEGSRVAEMPHGNPPPIGVTDFLACRSLWVLTVINFTINVGWILVGTLLPTYLIKIHAYSEPQAGRATSLVALFGMAGCLAGGVATDFFSRRLGIAWGRRVPCIFSYGGAAVSYAICYQLEDPQAIVALLAVSSFLGDFGLGALWCTYQDIGRRYSGTVLGVGNMWGNIGAAIGASFVPRLAEQYGWSASFALSAGLYAIAAVAWLAVDSRVPIGRATNA